MKNEFIPQKSVACILNSTEEGSCAGGNQGNDQKSSNLGKGLSVIAVCSYNFNDFINDKLGDESLDYWVEAGGKSGGKRDGTKPGAGVPNKF